MTTPEKIQEQQFISFNNEEPLADPRETSRVTIPNLIKGGSVAPEGEKSRSVEQ